MSDEDERMDRARRIREMREGRRDADPEEESTADSESGQPSEEGDPDPDESTADVDEGATDDSTDADSAETADQTPAETTDQAPAETDGDDSTEITDDDSTETDENPAAAASDSEAEEIDGPAGDDEWFDDASDATADDTPTGGSELSAEDLTRDTAGDDGGPDGDSPDSTDVPESDDGGETAAAAASAAAAFEVDPSEQDEQPVETAADEPQDIEDEPEQEEEIRVLEFRLGDEHYCLDIEHVEEIVKEESVTRVPNTPEHVHGVVDLRGQITTILDPKIALDIDDDGEERLLVVFGAETFEDQGHAGWIVDEVRQVLPITESEVKESPIDQQSVKGVIERDDEFIIWTSPEVALEDGEE